MSSSIWSRKESGRHFGDLSGAVVLVLPPFGYTVIHWNDSGFLPNMMGNWFATLVGAGVAAGAGIPIGLWINRKQEERERSIHEEEDVKHGALVLTPIREELAHNLEIADEGVGDRMGLHPRN